MSGLGILLRNGNIISVRNGKLTESNWLLAYDGKICQVGEGDVPSGVLDSYRDQVEVFDLEKRVVLPGLMDSHIHLYLVGKQAHAISFEGAKSIGELQEVTRREVDAKRRRDQLKHCAFVEGQQWDDVLLGRVPNRHDLDNCIGDFPAIFHRRCWHVCVVNSKTLEICGINASTPEVAGGIIDRDENGVPTGILREHAITELLKPLTQKEEPAEEQLESLRIGLSECVKRGVTAVQTNDSKTLGNISHAWKLYTQLADQKKLVCRVFLTVGVEELGTDAVPPAGSQHPSGLLSCDRVKIWTDGGLGASTAALIEPYSDDPQNSGVLQLTPEEIDGAVQKIKSSGFRVEAHAIGDRAATILADVFARSFTSNDRPIITHCQILNPGLVKTFARTGIIANVQPQFVPSDASIVRSRLGNETERFQYSYPWKTLISSGVRVAGGSDAPVEAPSPLVGIADAMDHVIHAHERLTFAEALEMYTLGAAYAANADARVGALESGMEADLVVLSIRCPASALTSAELRHAEVERVLVQGKQVYAASSVQPPPPALKTSGRNSAGSSGLMRHWRRGRCPCCF